MDKPWWYGPTPKPYVMGRIEFGPPAVRMDVPLGRRGPAQVVRQPAQVVRQPSPPLDARDEAVLERVLVAISRLFPGHVTWVLA